MDSKLQCDFRQCLLTTDRSQRHLRLECRTMLTTLAHHSNRPFERSLILTFLTYPLVRFQGSTSVFGRKRKQKTYFLGASTTTTYVWDNWNLHQIASNFSAPTTVYDLEPRTYGQIMSQQLSTGTSHFHYDAIDNTVQRTDQTSSVIESSRFSGYGTIYPVTGNATLFNWIGGQGYETAGVTSPSTFYIRHRWYHVQLARWMGRDPVESNPNFRMPIATHIHNLPFINNYIYSSNSPVLITDPTGLDPYEEYQYNGPDPPHIDPFGIIDPPRFSGKKFFYNCSVKENNMILKGVKDACNCIARTTLYLNKSPECRKKLLGFEATVTTLLNDANRLHSMRGILGRLLNRCTDPDFPFKIDCCGFFITCIDTSAYVRYNLDNSPGTRIVICPKFWTGNEVTRRADLVHEFGRLVGLGEINTGTYRDVNFLTNSYLLHAD